MSKGLYYVGRRRNIVLKKMLKSWEQNPSMRKVKLLNMESTPAESSFPLFLRIGSKEFKDLLLQENKEFNPSSR